MVSGVCPPPPLQGRRRPRSGQPVGRGGESDSSGAEELNLRPGFLKYSTAGARVGNPPIGKVYQLSVPSTRSRGLSVRLGYNPYQPSRKTTLLCTLGYDGHSVMGWQKVFSCSRGVDRMDSLIDFNWESLSSATFEAARLIWLREVIIIIITITVLALWTRVMRRYACP